MKNADNHINIQRHLATMPLFASLSEEDRTRLAHGCQLKDEERDVALFRTGDLCEEFYIVILGQVKLYVTNPAGQEKIVNLVGPGHSFAKALMFLNRPHFLNAQTLSNSLLLIVSKPAVIRAIELDTRFAMRMLVDVSRRSHGLLQDVEGYALHSGIQRVIGYLLRELGEASTDNVEAGTVSLQVSKASVASRLSLTPEYFSRVMHELETEGLISIDRRDIFIVDAQRLSSYGSC